MLTKSNINYDYSSVAFEEKYTYQGNDLGAMWSEEATEFKVWAPLAKQCFVIFYKEGDVESSERFAQYEMERQECGTYGVKVEGNWEGMYYTYQVEHEGEFIEACDPYAKAVGVNGKRAMVVNMEACNPMGWQKDSNPNKDLSMNDAIIYEMHIRDFSSNESSGIQKKGTYLGVIEEGTKNSYGQSTGIDSLKDLGITHVHMLPMFDFGSVDEKNPTEQYNWGYDPVNYNVPEGSYATNPYDGATRIRELKQMIQGLHQNGISVVMDVVYNHVYETEEFCFNQIVPGYFSRTNEAGEYSNGSYCGNDTASERSMVHKYIVDSILYWMEEYHIDGFRFDLVGLLDIDVINELVEKVHAKRLDVIFYGEGWNMPTCVTKESVTMATQMKANLTPGFAYFNDSIRDTLKGNYANELEPGYVNGATGKLDTLKANVLGLPYWSPSPTQTVQYISCHDDFGIFDRLKTTCPDASEETLAAYNRLAAAVVFLSQGIPFMHAGEEFLRSKVDAAGNLVSNSYNAPDAVNSIKWDSLHSPLHAEVREYYKGLIAFRKAHRALRLQSAQEIRNRTEFLGDLGSEAMGYRIDTREIVDEPGEELLIVFNPEPKDVTVTLPDGVWQVYIRGERAGVDVLEMVQGTVVVPKVSALACTVANIVD